jgi:putative resolvase
MKYIKLSEYAKNKSITYQTAHNHFKRGMIKGAYKDDLNNIFIPQFDDVDYSKAVLYARVSSNTMKENLIRQQNRLEEFAASNNYIIIKSVREIASGMNDKRPKLLSLLSDNNWNTLIIEHKDRLTRFGFNYIEHLLRLNNKRIITINESNEDKSDLINDLVSIIYSFSARMYGLRRKKNREDIIKFLEN